MLKIRIAKNMSFTFPFASSSFAAVIQTDLSVGIVARALFKTFLALSYVSSFARASHSSAELGQHLKNKSLD